MTDGFQKLTDREKLMGQLRLLQSLDMKKMHETKQKLVEHEIEALERIIDNFDAVDGQRASQLRGWKRKGQPRNNSRMRCCQRLPQEDE